MSLPGAIVQDLVGLERAAFLIGTHIPLISGGGQAVDLALVSSPRAAATEREREPRHGAGAPLRDDELADAIGELVNMLGGSVKRQMPGSEFMLGPPLFIHGYIEPSSRLTVTALPIRFGAFDAMVLIAGQQLTAAVKPPHSLQPMASRPRGTRGQYAPQPTAASAQAAERFTRSGPQVIARVACDQSESADHADRAGCLFPGSRRKSGCFACRGSRADASRSAGLSRHGALTVQSSLALTAARPRSQLGTFLHAMDGKRGQPMDSFIDPCAEQTVRALRQSLSHSESKQPHIETLPGAWYRASGLWATEEGL